MPILVRARSPHVRIAISRPFVSAGAALRVYTFVVATLAALSLLSANPVNWISSGWAIGVFSLVALAGERFRVPVGGRQEESVSLFVIILAGVLFGPLAGGVVGVALSPPGFDGGFVARVSLVEGEARCHAESEGSAQTLIDSVVCLSPPEFCGHPSTPGGLMALVDPLVDGW